MNDLLNKIKTLKPIKGQCLSQWLQGFLLVTPGQLDQWTGKFTEIITAKAVSILRKRGVIDEHEVNQSLFSSFVNAAYRTKVFVPVAPSAPANVALNPLSGADSMPLEERIDLEAELSITSATIDLGAELAPIVRSRRRGHGETVDN